MKRRLRIRVCGRVQGVGFRPAVYRMACEAGVAGSVWNDATGVLIEVEGDTAAVENFLARLKHPPVRATVESVRIEELSPAGLAGFEIVASRRSGDLTIGMPPDLATCEACARELLDPADRRYRYPFINCTDCGPRFTIIRRLPYDRERTSMAEFAMCERCAREYHDPTDRRFDAQPDACPDCGPQLRLVDPVGCPVDGEPVLDAARLLREGAILAIKGLGGYHLCCDALSDAAVARLRDRKRRPHKALAVMFRSLQQVEEHCFLNEAERAEISGYRRPVVIVARRPGSSLSPLVSPDSPDVGAFLPYTPLHHLLLAEISPLIMSSGNLADDPIAKTEEELKGLLGSVADAALVHNREIVRRCDDSVLRLTGEGPLLIRRSRGYVPDAMDLPVGGPPTLGCGGELKNAFCVTRGAQGFVSQHIGDLTDLRAYEFFAEATADLIELLEIEPEIVAHDLHPDFLSTRYAEKSGIRPRVAVQHHHAHIAAVMAEHGLTKPVIGVALDGMGLGDDGTLWGGEFLVADLARYRRVCHFATYRMPGGEQATLNPDRMAFSCLLAELNPDDARMARLLPGLDRRARALLRRVIEGEAHAPITSSAGRLFDAVSAMLGLCSRISYEGQAAIRLQTAATPGVTDVYPFEMGEAVLSFGPMIRRIAAEVEGGVPAGTVAAMFHNTVAAGVGAVCERVASAEGLSGVALSGGVFQNTLLLRLVTERLRNDGLDVYSHSLLPPNDACLSLGQVVVALAKAKETSGQSWGT